MPSASLYLVAGTQVSFTLDWRDGLLIVFFTTIGLSANVRMLVAGGRHARRADDRRGRQPVDPGWRRHCASRICSERIPQPDCWRDRVGLSGGHGTAIAWAATLKSTFDLPNALEIGTAAATFGLVAGGILGGPLGRFLIRRHRLEPTTAGQTSVGFAYAEEGKLKLDVDGMLHTLLVIAIAIGIGTQLNRLVAGWGFKLPEFVTALFAGIVLANVVPRLFPRLPWPTGTPPLAFVADLSLGLFLAMSLMSLQLWTLLEVAGPLLAILIVQTAVCWVLLAWVVFRLLGAPTTPRFRPPDTSAWPWGRRRRRSPS